MEDSPKYSALAQWWWLEEKRSGTGYAVHGCLIDAIHDAKRIGGAVLVYSLPTNEKIAEVG